MTGRAAGYCAGYDVPGYANPVPGRGFGFGMGGGGGRGWRWRHQYYATGLPGWYRFGYAPAWGAPPAWAAYGPYAAAPTAGPEVEMLKTQAQWLEQQLEAINRRVDELQVEE
jgi:hypothetical protein